MRRKGGFMAQEYQYMTNPICFTANCRYYGAVMRPFLRTLVVIAALLSMTACFAADRPISMPVLSAKPYGWLDEQGRVQGLYPDIAAALAKVTGLEIRVEVVPFARAASMVASGSGDVTLMFSNAFTEKKTMEAIAVFYTNQVVQLRPGLAATSRYDLAALPVGRMNGGCLELAEDTSVNWRFQDLTSQDSGVRMLLAGRIDGFCTATEALIDAITSAGLESNFQNSQRMVLASKAVWLMTSLRLPQDVTKRLVAGVRQIQKSGELAQIFKKRLGSSYVLSIGPR
jgi:ABC-type amino acid transport substrate-binding protein